MASHADDDKVTYTRLIQRLPSSAPFVGPEALERKSGVKFVLRLGANESAFGPSPRAVEAMREATPRVAWYADPEAYDLRGVIAHHTGASIESIQIGAGIDELLGVAVRLFVEPGNATVASLGAYPTFAFHATGYGATVERIPYKDDRNDLDALAEAARRTNARLVYLANPDNPSGSWRTGAEIAAFVDSLPHHCTLLLDEAYLEFAPLVAHTPIPFAHPQVMRFRTFSKAYGMAGARIGYTIAAPETIRELDKIRLHFGVNLVAQVGAQAALADQNYLAAVVAEVARGRRQYEALASDFGLTALPSVTNFVTIDVGGVDRARATVAALADAGVFIRMPGAPPLDRCIRVTVGAQSDRDEFERIFRDIWPSIASK
ncbi:MAG TPA: aminotransferase class I/II-fold pyridoxal phosphate-dependent enzyme [Ktedonobacterales bacterium]